MEGTFDGHRSGWPRRAARGRAQSPSRPANLSQRIHPKVAVLRDANEPGRAGDAVRLHRQGVRQGREADSGVSVMWGGDCRDGHGIDLTRMPPGISFVLASSRTAEWIS
jgi:hypothetical protein